MRKTESMIPAPLVSVVMPVYNGGKYVAESIESVLKQSFINFEFIIVNDGSTDNSRDVIKRYQMEDERIVYIEIAENKGISNALNIGIKVARGTYIVRTDCDDVCLPLRLEKQVEFIESNPGIGVLGTYFCVFFTSSVRRCETVPVSADALFDGKPPVHHPTCLIRKNIFDEYGLYNSKYDHAEDYELWSRWQKNGVVFYSMPKVLYRKRIHEKCTSVERIWHQIYLMLKVNLRAVFVYRIPFTWRGYVRIAEQILYLGYLGLRLDKIYSRRRYG